MLMRWVPTMSLEQIKPAFEARFDVTLQEEEDEDTGEKAEWTVELHPAQDDASPDDDAAWTRFISAERERGRGMGVGRDGEQGGDRLIRQHRAVRQSLIFCHRSENPSSCKRATNTSLRCSQLFSSQM